MGRKHGMRVRKAADACCRRASRAKHLQNANMDSTSSCDVEMLLCALANFQSGLVAATLWWSQHCAK
jgi:hypothetical protein